MIHPTETHPLITPMMSCDIMWHHRHDVALPPWCYWTLICCSNVKNFICHLTFLKKLWHSFMNFQNPMIIISWVWIIHKMLNVNRKKIHSIILFVICHSLRNFPHSYTSPCIHSWIFKTLQVIISRVWVTHKRLNVNWKKIHSITLSVTCNSLRNSPSTHTHPLISICEFLKPYKLLFLELESFINGWMEIGKKLSQ